MVTCSHFTTVTEQSFCHCVYLTKDKRNVMIVRISQIEFSYYVKTVLITFRFALSISICFIKVPYANNVIQKAILTDTN